ncbi:MAG: hypothetical protein M4579_003250 [Chaenotheca gracillima]|nr:MAG: hypothetical protein M4579_003250 [Chaenotheca gracillima]
MTTATTTTTRTIKIKGSAASRLKRSRQQSSSSSSSSSSPWSHVHQTSILSFLTKRCPFDDSAPAPAPPHDSTMVAPRSSHHQPRPSPSHPRSSRRVAGHQPTPSAPVQPIETSANSNGPPADQLGPRSTRRTTVTKRERDPPAEPTDSQPSAKRTKLQSEPLQQQTRRKNAKHVTISDDLLVRQNTSKSNETPKDIKQEPHGNAEPNSVEVRRRTRRVRADPAGSTGSQESSVRSAPLVSENTAKRKLRSQDGGSRFKSDLALFFPAYDEMISNEPKEQEFLTVNSKIFVVDEENAKNLAQRPSQPTTPSKRTSDAPANDVTSPRSAVGATPSASPYKLMTQPRLNNAQCVDFSSIEKASSQNGSTTDPLAESFYERAHARAERREKQLRNIEKNKAQHEKDNLERLLEGLKGHDWLRVMGISGITDSEKKEFEPKRDFFVKEVSSLLAKFKAWKEEEKRRKIEKEQALLAEEEEEEEDEEEEEGEEEEEEVEEEEVEEEAEEEEEEEEEEEAVEDTEVAEPLDVNGADASASSNGSPNSSELDRWAARQLQMEAKSATGNSYPVTNSRTDASISSSAYQHPPEPPPKPFTSFFSKPYLRAAAIGKHRRSGRSVNAFGHPIPDVAEQEFELPPEILTEETLIANARRRRRMRRASKDE